MKRLSKNSSITRREAAKAVTALGAGGLLGCSAADGTDASSFALGGRPRAAVLGGGAGGITAAYLLDSVYDVDLFESRDKLGGHCDSRVVDYQGQPLTVDLGAQFFHPATHPLYVTLLEELGLFKPDDGAADETLEAPGSICLFKIDGGWWPIFASQQPYLTPFLAVDFLIYSQAARQMVLQNGSWETTLEQWVNGLLVSRKFKDNVLYPWISSAIGTTRANAKRSSARSILQTFALAFPANIFESASTYNSKIGLEGNLLRMIERSANTSVHVNAPMTSLSYEGGAWTVQTPLGTHGPYEAVVMNAPPHTSKEVLRPLAWTSEIVGLLDQYEYFDSRLLIHTDAKYVHADRNLWAVYNGGVDGQECEGSVWYGGIHPTTNGSSVDVFKSWASHRRGDPANVLLERKFRHPLITPATIRAARTLAGFQGLNGLYFSGQFTTGMDLQEAAVYSAMEVARRLAPESTALAALDALLVQRGRSDISYAL